jgi:hypothetical protein
VEKQAGIMELVMGFKSFIDKLYGGVGSRRGRTNKHDIHGDSLDFWRVLYANKEKGFCTICRNETPEAWLEFKIIGNTLYQSATFRPRGIWGKLYWYSVLPFQVLFLMVC